MAVEAGAGAKGGRRLAIEPGSLPCNVVRRMAAAPRALVALAGMAIAACRLGGSPPARQPVPAPLTKTDELARIIHTRDQALQGCYQRALNDDPTLVSGVITVRVLIRATGVVDKVSIDGDRAFRRLDPCINAAISTLTFPRWSDEYGTEFRCRFRGRR